MAFTPSHVMNLLKSAKTFDKVLEKVKIISIGNGNCTAELKISEEHSNVMGGLHGGLSATLVDMISTYGLFSHKYGEVPSVSVDLHTTFMKAARVGDIIEIDSKTVRVGKNLAFLEVLIKK
ncbi:hypothetical protein NQ315_012760 [Exocentrus adspersus]|uniref:Acyl-coenzyme A thioesterase 13 n=1 Tax=Exocentrus adspersus TaxID=1586481 RepID=A0AAV8VCN2_9CUCU|nr:hypothetical protein NQ315_012760 [Exocentrus adspersus]